MPCIHFPFSTNSRLTNFKSTFENEVSFNHITQLSTENSAVLDSEKEEMNHRGDCCGIKGAHIQSIITGLEFEKMYGKKMLSRFLQFKIPLFIQF